MKQLRLKKQIACFMLFLMIMTSVTAAFAAPDLTGRDPSLPVSLTIHHRNFEAGDVVPGNPIGGGLPNPAGVPIVASQWQVVQVNVPTGFDWNDPAAVAAIPEAWHVGAAMLASTNGSGEAHFSGLAQGIYLVRELESAVTSAAELHRPFLVELPMQVDGVWIYDVHVYPKREVDAPRFFKELDFVDAYTIGWAISFEIMSGLHTLGPIEAGGEEVILITDALDPRLRLTGLRIMVEESAGNFVALPEGYPNWSSTLGANLLTVEIFHAGRDAISDMGLVGGMVRIEVETEIIGFPLGDALGPIYNTATLYYGPTASHTFGDYAGETIPYADVFGLELHKQNTRGQALEGAVFHLFRPNDTEQYDGRVRPIAGRTPIAILTSNEDGFDEIQGITEGTYLLVEAEAPAGYNRFQFPLVLEVNASVAGAGHIVLAEITNTADFELPLTGGAGTLLFTILGLTLIGGAVVLFLILGRKRSRR